MGERMTGVGCLCDGYWVDNWFYGYQVYCANPTHYWINPLGWILLGLIFLFILGYIIEWVRYR